MRAFLGTLLRSISRRQIDRCAYVYVSSKNREWKVHQTPRWWGGFLRRSDSLIIGPTLLNLHSRRFSLDIGWNDGGDRSCLGNGRARPWRRGGALRRAQDGRLSTPRRRASQFWPFSTWNRKPTASRKPSPMPASTCRRTFPSRRSLMFGAQSTSVQSRVHEETSQSPAKAIEHLRVEAEADARRGAAAD